jgi:hypothetical protein
VPQRRVQPAPHCLTACHVSVEPQEQIRIGDAQDLTPQLLTEGS